MLMAAAFCKKLFLPCSKILDGTTARQVSLAIMNTTHRLEISFNENKTEL